MRISPPSEHQRKRLSKYMSAGERLVLVTSIGKRYFYVSLVFLLILPLVLTYMGLFMFTGILNISSLPWLKYLSIPGFLFLIYNTPKYSHLIRMRQSYTYALTNRRFLIIRGIFARKIVTAPLTAITHVTVEQSFFQRFLFNTGHLVIITAGFDQREIVIENIGDPLRFKILIEELTEKIEEGWEGDNSSKEDLNLRSLSN